ncbi:MAG: beta-lactamase [Parcubacteria group bacterium Gr01-1014_31]|nr:MAG: beta-lactamase [Parcubacteria group bacterium Gr01-1014_31]
MPPSARIPTIIIGITCLGLGFLIGQRLATPEACCAETLPVVVRQSGYRLINPLLECEVGDFASLRQKYIPFEKVAKQRILIEVQQANPGLELAVYVRDLNNGPWFGINERDLFSPASLLKVPVLMSYLKAAESDPAVLTRELMYDGPKAFFAQQIAAVEPIRPGTVYPVGELLFRMIVNSDNDAKDLLKSALPTSTLETVYRDLGVEVPGLRSASDYMSVKDYASFFRILYNASYLDRERSEQALELMAKTRFRDGIIAGVPANRTVAHKFGERITLQAGRPVAQLHDCGIIYHPRAPYLLCVMTRGPEFSRLPPVIAAVSKIVYQEIDQAHPAEGK